MPMKMKNMKGINLSCASTTSTAICSSIDKHSIIKNTTKPLQCLNSYITDNISKLPCISELPFNPRPSSFSTYRDKSRKLTSIVSHSDVITRRRSSADVNDIKRYNKYKYSYENDNATHSSRYLLGESRYLDSSKNDTKRSNLGLVRSSPVFGDEGRRSTSRVETRRSRYSLLDDDEEEKEKEKIRKHFSLINVGKQGEICCDDLKTPSFVPNNKLSDKVVVLRVSIHCKGCEAKLRKHLSKMEGVSSFCIDLETKKVTVTGNVTPSDVLTSISRVKNAQFWPSQSLDSSTSSSTSSSSSSTIEFN